MSRHDKTLAGDATIPTTSGEEPRRGRLTIARGRYELLEELGVGGMGAVYRALDCYLGVTVALKILTLESVGSRAQLVAEVRLGRRVTHPNVVRIYDLGEEDGDVYLTMELFEGPSLETALREGPLGLGQSVRVGAGIAAGLAAVHGAGVVHRDLKPANVLLGALGRPVIADFGIAAEVGAAGAAVVGTPFYMAPEQLMGRPPSPASDLYALGLILFEALSGRRPFERDTPREEMMARLHAELPDLPDHIHSDLAAVVRRLVAMDPDDRFASATEAQARIRAAGERAGAGPPSVDVYAPMAPARNAIAVRPFASIGDAESGLGALLAEEVIEGLSRSRELRVVSLGSEGGDLAGPGIAVDCVLTGTVARLRGRLRVTARLEQAPSGEVLWSERIDLDDGDLFAISAQVSQRVVEALRLESATLPYRGRVGSVALDCFRRAREALAGNVAGARFDYVLHELDRCIELAPDFEPAYPVHALTCLDAWWGDRLTESVDRGQAATRSVRRALERAPERAETHVAAGSYALQVGEYREAAEALSHALAIAPTCARAHMVLGNLQLEAGRSREGVGRLEQSLELDPRLRVPHIHLARHDALRGDHSATSGRLDRLLEADPASPGLLMAVFRFGLWAGDRARAERALAALGETTVGRELGVKTLLSVGLGDAGPEVRETYEARRLRASPHPRFDALTGQVWIEVLAAAGHHDHALLRLENDVKKFPVVDVDWLRRCPVLEPLRSSHRFTEAEREVAERAAAIWR